MALRRFPAALAAVALVAGCTRGDGDIPDRGTPTAIDPSTTGTIRGEVRFDGRPPEPTKIDRTGDPACAGEPVRGRDVLVRDGLVENAFVHVASGLGAFVFERPEAPVVIDQVECLYEPHVIGVQTGQPIRFVNSDRTLHNVHTTPDRSRPVNFGMAIPGGTRDVRIPNAEVMVTVRCDVHPWMRAHVGVAEHPFFAVTGPDGRFVFEGLPAGSYEVEAWHERFGRRTAPVVLEAGAVTRLELEFGDAP